MGKKNEFTDEEKHSFILGFFEALPLWRGRHIDYELEIPYVDNEPHYYQAGRWVGAIVTIFALMGIAKIIQVVFW